MSDSAAGARGAESLRPLSGRRVVVTRPMDQAEPLILALRGHGAEVVGVPMIATEAVADEAATAATVRGATDLILTSANGVRYLGDALRDLDVGARIWAVGPNTAEALRHRKIATEPLPGNFSGAALGEHLIVDGVAGRRFVIAQADLAQPHLADRLRKVGADLTVVTLYRTFTPETAAQDFRDALTVGVDCVTFMSGSAVAAAIGAMGGSATGLAGIVVACIGPSTAAVARDLGVDVDVVAEVHTGPGLVDALVALWPSPPPAPVSG